MSKDSVMYKVFNGDEINGPMDEIEFKDFLFDIATSNGHVEFFTSKPVNGVATVKLV